MVICAYADKLNKNKLSKNYVNALNSGNVTTIDITGITPAPESEHEHIYKTHYDDTKHWEECVVCGIKRNEIAHIFTTTWANGKESCEKTNSYRKTCNCGYSEEGHKPCVWNGRSYIMASTYYHSRKCSICNGVIMHTFYLNSYGSGTVYSSKYQTTNTYMDYCRTSNGSKIDCGHSGTCSACKEIWSTNRHQLNYDLNTGELYCCNCDKKYGTCFQKIERDNENPGTYTITHTVKLTNGATWYQKGNMRQAGSPWETSSQTVNKTSNTQFIVTTIGKFKSTIKEGYRNYANFLVQIDGNIVVVLPKEDDYFIAMPDIKPPEISNIQLSGNEWTKSKPITISGTENWTETVNVKIENDRGKVVYEGGTNVTNNNWIINCTPEIEAGEESRTFTVTVTDSCENSTTKDFDVSKIDGRPPTVTSSDKVTNSEWARAKYFTFTAEDLGIGNVEIGFNDVDDYSLAIKDGTNYSKEYKFVGDAYSPVQASVYFKDGLGNITTQLVTLEKIDNTGPTITNAILNNNVVSITAHDRHSTLGEGSGVVKYRYITSTEKLENPEIIPENSQEIGKDEILTVSNINEVKYIYIVAEDLVGNTSESYEIEVPKITLTSTVSEEGANGKGSITLDWTGYDTTNKYFVIYRKKEDEEEWTTIVGKEERFNGISYIDNLGNDIAKPNEPEITIEKDVQSGQIKINQTATDNGTTYIYYIEAYDKNTNELIAKSSID